MPVPRKIDYGKSPGHVWDHQTSVPTSRDIAIDCGALNYQSSKYGKRWLRTKEHRPLIWQWNADTVLLFISCYQ